MSAAWPDGPTCAPPGAAPGYVYTLAGLAVIAHGIEELVGLPGWAARQGAMALGGPGFANAVIWITLVAVVILLLGRSLQFTPWVQRVVAVLASGLLFNAGAHGAISLLTWSIMPGAITGLILVLPSFGWLVARLPLARRDKLVAAAAGVLAMPLVAFAALRLGGGFAAVS